jgi:hypothetical protein
VSIVVSFTSPDFTADIYDAVVGKALPGGQLPEGCHVHIAGPVEQGWRVITVWDSEDAFRRFREEALLPAIREVAGEAGSPPPEPEVSPVHRLITE